MNWHVLGFIWTRSLFLANYVVIGAIAVFGSHGVTWRDMVILAKSRQVARHLPDEVSKGSLFTRSILSPARSQLTIFD